MCAEKTEERSWMTDEEAMGEGGGLEWETKASRLITELIMIFESRGCFVALDALQTPKYPF